MTIESEVMYHNLPGPSLALARLARSCQYFFEGNIAKKIFGRISKISISKKKISRQYFQNPNDGPDQSGSYQSAEVITARTVMNDLVYINIDQGIH